MQNRNNRSTTATKIREDPLQDIVAEKASLFLLTKGRSRALISLTLGIYQATSLTLNRYWETVTETAWPLEENHR